MLTIKICVSVRYLFIKYLNINSLNWNFLIIILMFFFFNENQFRIAVLQVEFGICIKYAFIFLYYNEKNTKLYN